jgi:LysM repeat protein
MGKLRAVRVRVLLPVTAVAMLFAPAIASGAFLHTVAPGESLSSIAALDGLSVSRLAAANGLAPNAQLIAGSTLSIPPQGNSAPIAAGPSVSSTSSGASPSPAAASRGRYVVQPGDTLSAIAARAGTSVARLAADNAIDPRAVLPSGSVLTLSPGSVPSSAPTQAPAVGTSIVGQMTWFGGPHDPGARGVPASGLGWRTDGMSFYNYGSLGHRWLISFPWGQTLNMAQIDIGPAPWTGNRFDIAFSALPNTPYGWRNWPNPIVTGTYQGSPP